MDKFKKLNGSRQVFMVMAVVMVLAGTLALPAAEKQERGYLGVTVQSLGKGEPNKNFVCKSKKLPQIFRSGGYLGIILQELNPDLDIHVPEMDIEVPPLPDMSHIEEAMNRVHEKLNRVKVKIEKRLERTSENYFI
jgi:hypothetical protein